MKLEILGLSEIRWPNFGEHRLTSGQILLYSGLQGEHAPRYRGVGFLLSAHAHAALMMWEPINSEAVATCTEYTHHEKCMHVVHSVSAAALQVFKDATARGLMKG